MSRWDLEHLNIINYALLLLSGCMSGGIWWALRLVGLLDERNVVEWSVLRCSGCPVLMCGRCVLLMVCRLPSRVPCGRSGLSPCCVLCATCYLNRLKTNQSALYIKRQFVPHRTRHMSTCKASLWMLYREKLVVCCYNTMSLYVTVR